MNEPKVARICWNKYNWIKPSGMEGKSKTEYADERVQGYGHEEWLFDFSKLIDGYHYAYLQAIGAHRDLYLGKIFDIYLYSIESRNNTRWWIGQIKNVQVVSKEESKRVHKIYQENKWFAEMIQQIKDIKGDHHNLITGFKDYFATIRFKIKDVLLEDPPYQFAAHDKATPSHYYNLKNYICLPGKIFNNGFIFKNGHSPKKVSTIANYEEYQKTIDLLHNKIQESIYIQLCSKYNKRNIGTEIIVNGGFKIDVTLKQGRQYTFYEIKCNNSLRKCVRDALTQLMEYSYFPQSDYAKKLIIISPNNITKEVKTYLKHLRTKFHLPIYYQQFNLEKNFLEDTIY